MAGSSRSPNSQSWNHDRGGDRGRGWDRDHDRGHDRDRDRFRDRRREFDNWYSYSYLPSLGYPYPFVIDPGFYDWGDNDSGDDQGSAADNSAAPYPDQGAPYPDQGAPYPGPGYQEPPQPDYADEMPPANAPPEPAQAGSAAVAASEPQQTLTVIFKDGRAPAKMQNYMLTATALTDLDHHKFEQIPLEEIDVAATRQANLANGIDFKVPGA